MFFKQIITYNDKFTLFSGVKIFWIVLNNKIFYFSTLYTNINYNSNFLQELFLYGDYMVITKITSKMGCSLEEL